MQHKEAHCVYAKHIHQVVRVKYIALGLAHLAVALQQPGMPEHLLRQRKIQSHQENRPVNGMEADNILSDQMQVCRPVLLEQIAGLSVTVITDSGDVVGQCVEPHVHHMLRIKIHRDSPLKGGTGYTEILQARKQKIIHHLIFPGHRLNEFRMAVDMIYQAVRILAHTEEIRLFLRRLHLTAAVRTLTIHQLGRSPEGFAGSTVQSLIGALVNIALVIELLENLLYLLLMVVIRRADKFIIRSIHQIPDTFDFPRYLIHKFLGRHPRFLSFQLYLLSMLVGSCLKEHIISLHSPEPRNRVRQYDLIGISDMRLARSIGNRRRHIKLLFFHPYFPFFSLNLQMILQNLKITLVKFTRQAQNQEEYLNRVRLAHCLRE